MSSSTTEQPKKGVESTESIETLREERRVYVSRIRELEAEIKVLRSRLEGHKQEDFARERRGNECHYLTPKEKAAYGW
jgi:hypothetical protein